jgi:hypothetical protein
MRLPEAHVGEEYAGFLTAAGGRGTPYEFAVADGRPPPGLELANALGAQSTVLSGVPLAAGEFAFSVRVRDGSGNCVVRALSVTVGPPRPLAIAHPGDDLNPGAVGVPYLQNLFATGGTRPCSWTLTAGALPPGLALCDGSGCVDGTPAAAGTFAFTVRLADSGGQVVERPFELVVDA